MDKLQRVKDETKEVIRRPSFGEGVSQMLFIFYEGNIDYDIVPLRNSLLDHSLSQYKNIITMWQDFKDVHPDLANRILELLFIDGNISDKIDDLLKNMDTYMKYYIKDFKIV